MGELVGLAVGELVGLAVGELVGLAVGELVGLAVGELVGLAVGELVGLTVGELVVTVEPDRGRGLLMVVLGRFRRFDPSLQTAGTAVEKTDFHRVYIYIDIDIPRSKTMEHRR